MITMKLEAKDIRIYTNNLVTYQYAWQISRKYNSGESLGLLTKFLLDKILQEKIDRIRAELSDSEVE